MPFFSSKHPFKKIILAIMMLALIGGAAYYSSGDDYTAKLKSGFNNGKHTSDAFEKNTRKKKGETKGGELDRGSKMTTERALYPNCRYTGGSVGGFVSGYGDISGGTNTDFIVDEVVDEFLLDLGGVLENVDNNIEPWVSLFGDAIPNGVHFDVNSVQPLSVEDFSVSFGQPHKKEASFQAPLSLRFTIPEVHVDAVLTFAGKDYSVVGPFLKDFSFTINLTNDAKGDLTFDYGTFLNRQHVLAAEAQPFFKNASLDFERLTFSVGNSGVTFQRIQPDGELTEIVDPVMLIAIESINPDSTYGFIASHNRPEYVSELENIVSNFPSISLLEQLHGIFYARKLLFWVHNSSVYGTISNFSSVFVHHIAVVDHELYETDEPYFCDSGQSQLQPNNPFLVMPSLPYVRDWINYNF